MGCSLIVALVLPSVALAGNPSDGDILGVAGSGGTSAPGNDVDGVFQAEALPFTGLNLALIVGIGVALVILGVVLRRRSAHQS
jgi:hypothetical protein